MRLYYLDASAWIKRYCIENGSERVAAFFAAGPAIGCSALGLVEVLCTLARKARSGEMSKSDAKDKGAEAERDFKLFHKVFLTPRLLSAACRCAVQFGLRGADTVHLASCLELSRGVGGSVRNMMLVSADAELLHGADLCGIPTVNPDETAVPVAGH